MSALRPPVITIDGPSGTGKGTVAGALAAALQWHILDSGAFYRAFGYLATKRGIGVDDEEVMMTLDLAALIQFQTVEQEIRILVEGVDVSETVREKRVAKSRQFLPRRRRSESFCLPINGRPDAPPVLWRMVEIWERSFFPTPF